MDLLLMHEHSLQCEGHEIAEGNPDSNQNGLRSILEEPWLEEFGNELAPLGFRPYRLP
jgi:hypothetical protein